MRFWDVTGPEVEAADAEPWDAPLASSMRPAPVASLVRVLLSVSSLYVLVGTATVIAGVSASSVAAHPRVLVGVGGFVVVAGLGWLATLAAVTPRGIRRTAPALGLFGFIPSGVLATVGLWAAGPQLGVGATTYVAALLFAFYLLRLPWALLTSAVSLVGFAAVVILQDGWAVWAAQLLLVAATVLPVVFFVGLVAGSADRLAESEHQARVELADLNHTLEERVDEQVTEIERLGGLRRFLSPQVADAVLSGEAEEVTRPHRRRIAVFFCDLRGFTSFTNNAEPEEVIGVLDEYYGVVGRLLQRYDATVGDYAGDGIMAYFGDPVPRTDSAMAAVEMTREIAGLMGPIVAEWQRRGYELDYGVGLAYGYATLGVIGFDGRHDYKPVGGVVNLAARLCAAAGPAQVLLDHPTYAETSESFPSAHFADLDLKGYSAVTRAYALT